MAPSAQLVYESSEGDGYAGWGWSLQAGQQTIHRCNKTVSQDGESQGITHTPSDRLCLNGNRLIKTSTGTYGTPNTEYRTEIATHQRIEAKDSAPNGEPNYFLVTNANGVKQYFGTPPTTAGAPNGRIVASNSSTTRVWALSRVVDPHGNYMDYHYSTTDPEEYYLDYIEYTGSTSLAPRYVLDIVHENRATDAIRTYYQAGSKIKRSKLIDRIEVKLNSVVIREYDLQYEAISNTGRQRLESITHCAFDPMDGEQCLKSLAIDWYSSTPGWTSGDDLHASLSGERYLIGDFDGDGMDDLFSAMPPSGGGDLVWWLSLGSDGLAAAPIETDVPALDERVLPGPAGITRYWDHHLIDYNDDGRMDIIRFHKFLPEPTKKVYLSTGSTTGSIFIETDITNFGGFIADSLVEDYDGDGLDDLVFINANTGILSVSRNSVTSLDPLVIEFEPVIEVLGEFEATLPGGTEVNVRPDQLCCSVNLNNDGKADFLVRLRVESPPFDCGQSVCFSHQWAYMASTASGGYELYHWGSSDDSRLWEVAMDINGDGLDDISHFGNGNQNFVEINTGAGFTAQTPVSLELPSTVSESIVIDYNNDGKMDRLVRNNPGTLFVYLSNGEGFGERVTLTGTSGTNLASADVDGDGNSDLLERVTGAVEDSPQVVELPPLPSPCGNNCEYEEPPLPQPPPPVATGAKTRLRLNNAVEVDLIDRITDGYGNYSDFGYESLAGSSNYTLDRDSITSQFDLPYWGGMFVVTQHAMSDGILVGTGSMYGEYQHSYAYENAVLERTGRGYQGFSKIEMTDSRNGIHTERFYEQFFPRTGRMHMENVYQTDDSSSEKIGSTILTWNDEDIALDVVIQADQPVQQFVFLDISSTTESVVNPSLTSNGDVFRKTEVDYDIANAEYGQLDKVTTKVYAYTGGVGESLVHTLINDFTPTARGSSDPWCLTLLDDVTETADDGVNVATNRKHSFVPNKIQCRNDGVTQFSNASDTKDISILLYGYDSFGNHTRTVHKASGSPTFANGVVFTLRRHDTNYESAGYFPKAFVQCFNDTEAGACTEDTDNPYSNLEFDDQLGMLTSAELITKNVSSGNPAITRVYDRFGRLLNVAYPDSEGQTYLYEDCADVTIPCWADHAITRVSMSTESGRSIIVELDAMGRVVGTDRSTIVKDSTTTTVRTLIKYDSLGRVVERSNPFFSTTANDDAYQNLYVYDLLGRVKNIYQPIDESTVTGRNTIFTHNGLTLTRTDAGGRITRRVVDVLGRLVESYEEAPTTAALSDKITYTYDEWGNLISTTNSTDDPDSVITRVYDIRGRVISESDPNRGLSTYKYDPADALIWMRDAKLQTRTYQYDSMGRLVRREDIETGETTGVVSKFEYYNNKNNLGFGRLRYHWQDPNEVDPSLSGPKVEYFYDDLGRLVDERTSIQSLDLDWTEPTAPYYSIERSYNGVGQLQYLTYPVTNGSDPRLVLEHTYSKGVLTGVSRVGGAAETFYSLNDMDVWGNVKETEYENGVVNQRIHNLANPWLDSLSSSKDLTGIRAFSYDWDNVGNLTERKRTIDGALLKETLTYDTKYRLKTSVVSECGLSTCASLNMTYTANGNILGKSDVGAFYEYGVNAGPHAVSKIWDGPGKTNEIARFDYDANGNQITRSSSVIPELNGSIVWTTFDKPAYIDAPGGESWLYYDANYSRYRLVEQQGPDLSETLYIGGLVERQTTKLESTNIPVIGFRQYIIANGERVAVVNQLESILNSDGDSFADPDDNCSLIDNEDQRDTNADGFGNKCDPDLNDDDVVNFTDIALFTPAFGSEVGDSNYSADADFNGDGFVNFLDYVLFTDYFMLAPGPANTREIEESVNYLHTNHLGSIDTVTDEEGGLIGEYSYDAFGKRRNPYTWGFDPVNDQEHLADGIGWTTTTRGFTDHEQLRAAQLIHMNGRVYDPLIGRMTSADPLIPDPTAAQSFNRYSYVRNNPLSRTDPSGFTDLNQMEEVTVRETPDAPGGNEGPTLPSGALNQLSGGGGGGNSGSGEPSVPDNSDGNNTQKPGPLEEIEVTAQRNYGHPAINRIMNELGISNRVKLGKLNDLRLNVRAFAEMVVANPTGFEKLLGIDDAQKLLLELAMLDVQIGNISANIVAGKYGTMSFGIDGLFTGPLAPIGELRGVIGSLSLGINVRSATRTIDSGTFGCSAPTEESGGFHCGN